jgi:hypothetical protein
MLCTTKYNVFSKTNNTYTNFLYSCMCMLLFMLFNAIPLFIIGVIARQVVYLSCPPDIFHEFCNTIFYSYIFILCLIAVFPMLYFAITVPFVSYKLIKKLLRISGN